jgi:hypothetical protein
MKVSLWTNSGVNLLLVLEFGKKEISSLFSFSFKSLRGSYVHLLH